MRIKTSVHRLCIQLGLSTENAEEISFSSMMHDVGKIHIPDAILQKPGRLTRQEFEIIKTHTTAGHAILGNKPFYQTARDIALAHHERWDGNGYPFGIKGVDIPLAARIVAVADVFDALTHHRVYKLAWPREKALDELKRQAGTQFDPEVVAGFLQLYPDETC
jgi:HD-GYP domain-containing protein (c-di-GMP phosphodiesterase class II)